MAHKRVRYSVNVDAQNSKIDCRLKLTSEKNAVLKVRFE